jgi:hypothetical protein
MLRVEYDGEKWVFLADDEDVSEWAPRLCVAFPPGRSCLWGCAIVTRHEVELGEGIALMGIEDLRDPTTGIRYKLTPIEGGENMTQQQTDAFRACLRTLEGLRRSGRVSIDATLLVADVLIHILAAIERLSRTESDVFVSPGYATEVNKLIGEDEA